MSIAVLAAGFLAGAALFAREMVTDRPMHGKLPTAIEIASLPPDGGEEFNRLIHASSPYLLQHAANPVDWFPWGQEAFERARKEDKPIFLSVGYSTCHWCHVMAAESFEDDEVARLLNEHFVSIKVDREELPEVDEIYMNATQLVTGSGGWPNSLWLDHERKPWFAGTYFPKDDMPGRRGFKTLLRHLADLWKTRRDEVEKQADQLWNAVERATSRRVGDRPIDRAMVRETLTALREAFDPNFGGFGGAPKFPPHSGLRLILSQYARTGDRALLPMATTTLDAMSRGGIRDHIGGGFHRYATDTRWLLPHFEKMLYDNAQLLRAYTDAYGATGLEHYRDVARDICLWVIREMTDPEGGFYSGIDADSEGREGKFYTWTWDEVMEALGEEDGALFAKVYGLTHEGNVHDEATGRKTGRNVPYLERVPERAAAELGLEVSGLQERLRKARSRLLAARSSRVRPHTDDKVLAGWNGLMIGALAHAGAGFDREEWVAAASEAAEFVLEEMRPAGRLVRSWRRGRLSPKGYLGDYALMAEGLLELHEATGEERWLEEARKLADSMVEDFRDPSAGGFFFTAEGSGGELLRYKDAFDKQVPSANGTAALVLVRLWDLTGEKRYLDEGRATIESAGSSISAAPRATETLVMAAAEYLDSLGGAEEPAARGMKGEVRHRAAPVTIELYADSLQVAPGDVLQFAVKLEIDEGWHINSSSPLAPYLPATAVILGESDIAELKDVSYPEGTEVKLGFSEEPLSVYEGVVWIRGDLAIAQKGSDGPVELSFEVRWQACDDRKCLQPEKAVLPLEIEVSHDAPRSRRHPEIFD